MKYLIISVLFFTTINCLAIDKRLVDGAHQYESAIANLNKINNYRAITQMSIGDWIEESYKTKDISLSEYDRKVAQNKINEEKKLWHALDAQHVVAERAVKKYELVKKEYDKQVQIESEQDRLRITILSTIIVLIVFVGIFWRIIFQYKKYKRLLQQGKITQEEYDNVMRYHQSHVFEDERTNPATGLRMIGGVDSGGNPSGCSFNTSSTFNYSQDYRDRHRWDG